MSKEYRCICGQIFDNPQKFNGHKQGCKEHIINKYGSVDYFYSNVRNISEIQLKLKSSAQNKKFKEEQDWIAAQHTCEKCGKVMTKKFGSGRFCSRHCSNSRQHSDEMKNRISQSVKDFYTPTLLQRIQEYLKNPKQCCVCGSELSYQQRDNQTCSSKSCISKLSSQKLVEINGKRNCISTYGHNKYGTYKGFHCDSSWELAFVVFCLDNNVPIKRCTEKFEYFLNNEKHYYYPDFIINNDTYVEVKNYLDSNAVEKLIQFPYNLKYVILFWDSIKPVYDYAISTYGLNFCQVLYDKTLPNYYNKSL